jgi:hypothetical protein
MDQKEQELNELITLQSVFSNWIKITQRWGLQYRNSRARSCGGEELTCEVIAKSERFYEITRGDEFWENASRNEESVYGMVFNETLREMRRALHA